MLSLSTTPSSPVALARDWAVPRNAVQFTGSAVCGDSRGPGGALLLCVANTPIPCKLDTKGDQKSMLFTVINVRDRGWMKAPWYTLDFPEYFGCLECYHYADSGTFLVIRKKPSGKASKAPVVREDNAKDLFEIGEWARDEVTFDRVGKSVLMYSFIKEGSGSRGERVDDKVSCISSGCTFRVVLNDFLFEDKDKKSGGEGSRNVFPSDIDVIPAFSVVEVAINPANSGSFDEGYGINVARIRPCTFTLYSMMTPLGLSLLHPTHAKSTAAAEAAVEVSPGLRRVVEPRNTGFFAQATQGSYVIKYSDDIYRLVGPKQDPADPLSRHDDAVSGGVFAVDIHKTDLVRFTNAVEEEEEDGLIYAQFVVDFASSAGALNLYVVHNEYLLRKDPNRSPFTGVPLLDTSKLLACVAPCELGVGGAHRFPLPFPMANMDGPFLKVDPACVDNNSGGEPTSDLPCGDMVLASENARVRSAYPLCVGDLAEEDIMRFLFVPKSRSSAGGGGGGRGGLDRMDYRLLKKQRTVSGAE